MVRLDLEHKPIVMLSPGVPTQPVTGGHQTMGKLGNPPSQSQRYVRLSLLSECRRVTSRPALETRTSPDKGSIIYR